MNLASRLLRSGFLLDSETEVLKDGTVRTRYIRNADIKGLEHLQLRDVFMLENGNLYKYLCEISTDIRKDWAANYYAYRKGRDPGRHQGFSPRELLRFPYWIHTALEHLVSGKLDKFDIFILMLSIYDETTYIQARTLFENRRFMKLLTTIANFFISKDLKPRIWGFWNYKWFYTNYIMSCGNENVYVILRWINPPGRYIQIVYTDAVVNWDDFSLDIGRRLLKNSPSKIHFYTRIIDCEATRLFKSYISELLRELSCDIENNNWRYLPEVELDRMNKYPTHRFFFRGEDTK